MNYIAKIFSILLVAFAFTSIAHAITNTNSIDLESSSNQYLSITDANQTGLDITGDLSAEAWIKLESFPSTNNFFSVVSKWDEDTNNRSYRFDIWDRSGDYKIGFSMSDNGLTGANRNDFFSDALSISTGEWHHIAITFDASASTASFYLNGTAVGTDTGSLTSIHSGSAGVYVGSEDGVSNAFDGLLDEVRIWDDIRSTSEIDNNKYTTLVGTESNLVSYWSLNSTTTDATSNGNDLTTSGSPSFSEEPAHQIICTLPTDLYFGSAFSLNISCNLFGLF